MMKYYTRIIALTYLLIACYGCSNNSSDNGIINIKSSSTIQKVDSGFSVEKQMARIQSDSSYLDYRCSIKILKTTNSRLDKLDLVIIADFLATFHHSCNSNVEYSEWANELLFKTLNRKPEIVLQLLIKNSSLDRNYILKQLESPINDAINLDSLVKKIKKVEKPSSDYWKPKIIETLITATGKNKNDL
jgi:hypothetical protein